MCHVCFTTLAKKKKNETATHAKLQAFQSSREYAPAPSARGCLNFFDQGSTTADKSQPIPMLLIGAADNEKLALHAKLLELVIK